MKVQREVKSELLLTITDSLNYNALINILYYIPVLKRKRDSRDCISSSSRFKIAVKQNWQCLDCGFRFEHKGGKVLNSTQEHIIPFRYGSRANKHNIVLLCGDCNEKRAQENPLIIIEEHYGPINYNLIEKLEGKPINGNNSTKS